MTSKEELIFNILKKGLPDIIKTGKNQKEILKNVDNDKDIHPSNIMSIKTGTSYTHGYCIGHEQLCGRVLDLLDSNEEEILEMLEREKEIEKKNKEELNRVFDFIKSKSNK